MKRFNHKSMNQAHAKMDTEFSSEFVETPKRESKLQRQGRQRVGGRVSEKLDEISEGLMMNQASSQE